MTDGPPYDELPPLGSLGLRHARGVWGSGDTRGTLNRLTDDRSLAALRIPRSGRRVNLSLPLSEPSQPLFGRRPPTHRAYQRNRNMVEDELDHLDPQASSQWDSLRHIAAREFGFFNQSTDWDGVATRALGVDNLVATGLVMRGVLVDFPAFWLDHGERVDPLEPKTINAELLQSALVHQHSRLLPGDLLLIRTGWLDAFLDRGLPAAELAQPASAGLAGDEDMARLLWDAGICAVASDNPAVEVLPADPSAGSLHRRLIAGLGMPLGELWALDELAAICRTNERWEVCVVSVPLNIPAGVASPANALAIL